MDEERRFWQTTDATKGSQPLAFHQTIQVGTCLEFKILHYFHEASALRKCQATQPSADRFIEFWMWHVE